MAGSPPAGQAHGIIPTGSLPVTGSIEVPLPVEELWDVFCEVEGWRGWNAVREDDRQRRGTAFSLREFHERALKESAVPMPVLGRLLGAK